VLVSSELLAGLPPDEGMHVRFRQVYDPVGSAEAISVVHFLLLTVHLAGDQQLAI